MKKNNLNYTIIIILVTIMLIIFTMYSAKSSVNSVINYIFLLFMFVIVFISILINLGKAESFISDLKKAKQNVSEQKKIDFNAKELENAYQAYSSDLKRLTESRKSDDIPVDCRDDIPVDCRIEDYFNAELLNVAIKKNICESIAGSMTGFGILGTFIGLIIGLNDFNTGYDEIQGSIQILLNGIKTSFLTSIYGVCFSLVFNWMFRTTYQKMIGTLDDFCNMYNSVNKGYGQQDINTKMVVLQSVQNKTITDIKDKWDKDIKDKWDKMADDMVKIFQVHMSKATNNLIEFTQRSQKEISDYLIRTEQTQYDQLQKMVREYLRMMNEEIFGGQLKDLRESIDVLSDSLSKSKISVNEIIEHLKIEVNDLVAANERYTELEQRFVVYIGDIERYQNQITNSENNLRDNLNQLYSEYHKNAESVDRLFDVCEKMQEQTSKLTESCEKLDENLVRSENSTIEMEQSVIQIADRMSSLIEQSSLVVGNTARQTDEINTALRKTIDEHIDKNSITLKKLSEEFTNSSEKLSERYDSLVKKLNEDLAATFNEFDKQTAAVASHMGNVLESIDTTTRGLSTHIEKTVRYELAERKAARDMQKKYFDNSDDGDSGDD